MSMTVDEAVSKLQAKIQCMEYKVTGVAFCIEDECDDCHLLYEQGNVGEQIECLRMAIKALKQEPCEDCVSRQAVRNALLNKGQASKRYKLGEIWELNLLEIEEALNELPSVTPQNQWHKVEDELPKEYQEVILHTDADETFIADYLGLMNDGVPCFDDNNGMMCEGDVIAWMPLPQPYKAESEE